MYIRTYIRRGLRKSEKFRRSSICKRPRLNSCNINYETSTSFTSSSVCSLLLVDIIPRSLRIRIKPKSQEAKRLRGRDYRHLVTQNYRIWIRPRPKTSHVLLSTNFKLWVKSIVSGFVFILF